MKTPFIILIGFSLAVSACKKEKKTETPKPNPVIQVKFGYADAFQNFLYYKNQKSIPVDSVKDHELFVVSLLETNLSANHGFTVDSGVIEYDIHSNQDAEHFNNRVNINNKSTFVSSFFGVNEFGSEMALPIKISPTAIHGNDTIEINGLGDKIKFYYQSKYTGLIASDSLILTP